ncbi:MAG TPA: NADH-quinone oxidoreductase subunit M [candidate division Zixibacteria bacterium]|nr:NADH-quinone oxidoreductase subunit M [candidate division Zixibacteria bacterium]MDD4916584.1 NADH-quinone oxidoreductase subunit M [candidate division Zixibacteria bacterium]MDM7973750.1 NADH-quinone oxidoreductase subunit M [candidate division Zixibacteria bacterium]HOD67611.1 NADH-quinone oxidoreductase subunit M [candidate division Zixibacteria bacterium]HPM37824.1 NADH-quinone oxidoreductase subunit M [candidate division Zixibacteria bacterium]
MLSLLVFVPLAGMLIVMLLPKDNKAAIRWTAFGVSLVPMVLSFWVTWDYFVNKAASHMLAYVEGPFDWIPSLNIQYYLGVDGISVPMLALTGLLSSISLLASFNIEKRVKEYFAFFLLLEAGMMGVFVALDFFLFYVFWEVMLVPMYFLIGIWGGPRKEYAAIKFFLYTLFGSIFMLVAILILYFSSTPHTLNMVTLLETGPGLGHGLQMVCFAFFFIAFAIKVPVWPFHTWLPDAHVEAPTAVSVILAGVLLKMGTYAMLRISWPMFPSALATFGIWIAVLGAIGIIYGALVSMAQKDLKKLVAYSSVSHMGYCMLALGAYTSVTALAGVMFQMISHGLITGALFLLVGVLYDRAHTREIAAFGGLGVKVPVYTGLMVLFGMASLGLPGMSGFVSEFMVFVGAFMGTNKILVGISVLGVVLGATYILRMVQRVFLGEFDLARWGGLTDINLRELICVAPLAVLTIAIGVYPKPVEVLMGATLQNLVNLMVR